jgi:hypothetical protein
MSGKEQFVKLPRDLLSSPAWQAQSINCRRLIDFLMFEHMRCGGKKNGLLVAPRRQLCAAGINNGDRVTEAINEAEQLGLIDIERGDRRRPNRYALTWLPLYDDTAPCNRWREYRKVMRDNPPSGVGDNPPSKASESCRDNPPSLYRSSYQGGGLSKEEAEGEAIGAKADAGIEGEATAACPGAPPGKTNDGEAEPELDPMRTCRGYVTNSFGFRICGNPVMVGTDHCPDHVPLVVGAR